MDLLYCEIGELGQTGHGRSEVISPEEALLKEFATSGLNSVKLHVDPVTRSWLQVKFPILV